VATHGPVFRYERPQKGRYRQFHQIDAEVIGAAEPLADVELLVMADQLLKELGIADGVTLQLNTLGDADSREAWRAALVEYFRAHVADLSEDSQDRLERNPLRILDSKDPRDKAFVADAPRIDDFLSGEAQDFFGAVTSGLDAAGVRFERTPALVRGLDYYRHTAFEFVTDRLGAQGTVLAGGRYDGLMESLGGPPTPAVGWAAGIERLAMLVEPPAEEAAITVLAEHEHLFDAARLVVYCVRRAGIAADADFRYQRSNKAFDKFRKRGAKLFLIVDQVNLESGAFTADLRFSGELPATDELMQLAGRIESHLKYCFSGLAPKADPDKPAVAWRLFSSK
jgi:histidyl-tRNA synthetase